MDETVKNSFRAAKARAEALRSVGRDDDYIVDSLTKLEVLPQQARDILKQAKAGGMSAKAVEDIMALPTAENLQTSAGEFEAPGKTGSVARFLGIEKIGRYAGSKLAQLDPQHRANLETLEKQGVDTSTLRTGGVSGKEALGSAALAVGQIAAPGLASAATRALGGAVRGGAALGAAFGAAEAVEDTGQFSAAPGGALTGAVLGGALPLGGRILGKVSGYVRNRFPKLLSIATGEDTEAIKAVLKNPEAADRAIQNGDAALRDVVRTGAEKSIQVKDAFVKAHSQGLKQIGSALGNQTLTNADEASDIFSRILADNGVKVTKDRVLDFAQSRIQARPGEASKIQQAWNVIQRWDDWSFSGTNEFKRLVGDLRRFADEAGVPSKSPALGKFYRELDGVIKQKLPADLSKQYSQANAKFEKTIDLYDDMVDAFNKGDPFVRIANLFSKNKDTLREVVDFYEKKTGESVSSVVGARELAADKKAAFGILNPRSWIDFFWAPETQAKAITKLGRGQQKVSGPVSSVKRKFSEATTLPVGEFLKRNPNRTLGLSVEDVTSRLSSAEKGTIRDFVDSVYGGYKPTGRALTQLREDAQEIADKYGFGASAGTDKSLANQFGEYLDKQNFDRKFRKRK